MNLCFPFRNTFPLFNGPRFFNVETSEAFTSTHPRGVEKLVGSLATYSDLDARTIPRSHGASPCRQTWRRSLRSVLLRRNCRGTWRLCCVFVLVVAGSSWKKQWGVVQLQETHREYLRVVEHFSWQMQVWRQLIWNCTYFLSSRRKKEISHISTVTGATHCIPPISYHPWTCIPQHLGRCGSLW